MLLTKVTQGKFSEDKERAKKLQRKGFAGQGFHRKLRCVISSFMLQLNCVTDSFHVTSDCLSCATRQF